MTFVVKFSNDDERARAKKILEDAGGRLCLPIVDSPPYQQFVIIHRYPEIFFWDTISLTDLYQHRPAVSIEDLPTYLKLISI